MNTPVLADRLNERYLITFGYNSTKKIQDNKTIESKAAVKLL